MNNITERRDLIYRSAKPVSDKIGIPFTNSSKNAKAR